jgi:hypothetical protein
MFEQSQFAASRANTGFCALLRFIAITYFSFEAVTASAKY